MGKRRFTMLIVLLAAALLLPATPALALADDGPPDGNGLIIWNKDHTVEDGETVDGDLIVFNGDLTVEAGGRVKGSAVVWNGSANVEGAIEGDLVVSIGDIYLGDNAWVEGSVICSWKCTLDQEEGARIGGSIVEGTPLQELRFEEWRGFPITVPSPLTVWASGPGMVLNLVLSIMRSIVAVLVVAAVAGLVALIWPDQTARVGKTIVEAPGASFGIGLLTLFATVVLVIALVITICLPPFVAMALGVAGLFGWICIGALVGKRLLQALNARETAPMWAAGLGTLIISLLAAGLDLVPCVNVFGWLLVSILGCFGLGAVVLTRFGTTTYPLPHPAPPVPPPAPTPSEEPAPPEPPRKQRKKKTEVPSQ